MGAEAFSGYLMPGESLVWWGEPRQGLMLSARDIFLVPFSLVWGGFAFFAMRASLASDSSLFSILFGAVFAGAGAYFILGRFIVDAWVRRLTVYAVSNKRVLIRRSAPFTKFIALGLDQLPQMDIQERRNGRGTIRFGPSSFMLSNGYGRSGSGVWSPALDVTPQFIGIEDARNVFTQIQNSIARARTP